MYVLYDIITTNAIQRYIINTDMININIFILVSLSSEFDAFGSIANKTICFTFFFVLFSVIVTRSGMSLIQCEGICMILLDFLFHAYRWKPVFIESHSIISKNTLNMY